MVSSIIQPGQPYSNPGVADNLTAALSVHNTNEEAGDPSLISYETAPTDHSFDIWTGVPFTISNSTTITAGKVNGVRMWVPLSCSISQLAFHRRSGGTGATPLANAFFGLYSKNGVLLGSSPDMSAAIADTLTPDTKEGTLTPAFAGALDLEGGEGECVYAVFVLGQQSTTVLACGSDSQQASTVPNAGLVDPVTITTFKTGYSPAAFQTAATGLTALPASIDMTQLTLGIHYWAAAR